jgi:hypothetical protein
MSGTLAPPPTIESLRSLFTKPYGAPGPTQAQWRAVYAENVHFQDPTQERNGIEAYLAAQEGLLKRCDDVSLVPGAIALTDDTGFVEWVMGLKIRGIEFVYPGATRLHFDAEGRIDDHRDYFDFALPTFGPVPLIGGFTRWLYGRFVG